MIARFFTPKGLAIACAVSLALGFGAGWTVNGWRLNARFERIQSSYAEALRVATDAARKAEQKARDASAAADQKQVEIQERIRTETITLIKEVPTYVTPETDVRYALPVGLVRLHDDAASGSVSSFPDTASDPDAAARFAEPSPVPASKLGTVIAENYGQCRADQARLAGLQDWLREQRDIYEGR